MKDQLVAILPKLRRFAFALTGSSHDADDLVQGTIEKLLVKGVPDDADVTRWAFRVSKNLWIDEVRKRKIRTASEFDESTQSVDSNEAESQAISNITLQQVSLAMDKLPNNQRIVLSMATVVGLSYAEIATILEIPVGTVMSRLSRARQTLVTRFDTDMDISELDTPKIGGPNELH